MIAKASVPRRVAYFAGTHGNWGGSSRVLFTTLRLLDRRRFDPLVLLTAHGPAEALLDDLGIRHQVWGPMTEPGNPIAYLRALARIYLWLRREGIELVHLNRANAWRPAEILAMRLCRVPIVTHFHTVNLDHAPATRWSSAIAAVSDYVARYADTQGVRTVTVHNTVDLDRFSRGESPRAALGIAPDQVVVGFVGQIRAIKGVADFIAMARHIPAADVRFLIAGQCRDKAAMGDAYSEDELRQMMGVDPRMHYCGYVEKVEDIYRGIDILVAPSRWQEPFGLIAIEAGAAGLPVVATRSGGLPEVIVDGETGFLAEIGDAQALAGHVVPSSVTPPCARPWAARRGRGWRPNSPRNPCTNWSACMTTCSEAPMPVERRHAGESWHPGHGIGPAVTSPRSGG